MRVNIETERQDLFDVSILIGMRIHIRGSVTENALKESFEKAVKTHEILGMRVGIDDENVAYYETAQNSTDNTNHEDIKIENKNVLTFCTDSWLDIIKREEKKRFRIEEGEFLKAFVYEMDEEGCGILFLMHHLGGDGKSLVYFIETFMNELSGLNSSEFSENEKVLEIRTIPAGDMSDEALKDKVGPLAIVPKIYNAKWQKEEKRRTFDFFDLDEAYETYWKDKSSTIQEYVISPERVSKILSRCKEWNIGFTAYITTSFLRWKGTKMDIGYAVDAREDGNRSMGNQATGISIKYAYNYDKSFEYNAIKVQKLMTKKLEDDEARRFVLSFMAAFDNSLLDALNLEHAGTFSSKTSKKLAKLLGYGKNTKDLSITNLTRLDIPDTYGDFKLDYFSFIPPVISYGRNILGLATLGDCTVMTLHRVK